MKTIWTVTLKPILKRVLEILKPGPNRFLRHARGVIHVGANSGQERTLYAAYGLNVCWIEPIPEVFEKLRNNTKAFKKHVAINALVADKENQPFTLNVANNDGESSSIFDLDLHQDIWPKVGFNRSIDLKSDTLVSVVFKNKLDIDSFDCLIMDTQGAELLVLKGAEPYLNRFKFIKTEAADFEVYSGCCQIRDLVPFLKKNNFQEIRRDKFADHPNGGACYDLLFENVAV